MTKEEAIKYLQQLYPYGGHCWLDEQRIEAISMAIKALQEEPKFKTGDHIKPIDSSLGAPRTILEVCDGWYVTNQGTLDFEFEDNWELVEEPVSEELEKVVEEIVNPTVLNAYGVKEIANRLRRTMIEPVSEEWIKELRTKLDSMSKEDFEKVFDKYAVDFNEEPVSDDLKQAIHDTIFDLDERKGYTAELTDMFMAGFNFQKQQMMAKAIDVEVKVDAGGYPYIPQMELYDYDKDIPLAKEGDKYKVVLIKK